LLLVALPILTAAATAAEPMIEPCLEPMMIVHVRAEGFPVREEIALCLRSLDSTIFHQQAPRGSQRQLPVELRREETGAVVRFMPEGRDAVTVRLSANAPERRVEGLSSGGGLLVRLESRPLPEDPLTRTVSLDVEDLPIPDLVARLARTIDHRVEGADRLCDATMSLYFTHHPLPARGVLSLLADECKLRIDRSGDGVIRIDPDSDRPWAEVPPLPAQRLLAELASALAKARTPLEADLLLTQADIDLAALDPDRIGPEWLDLRLLRARHGPQADRPAQLEAALDLHSRLLPTDRGDLVDHDRQTAALLAERAESLVAAGRRSEALLDYERAIELDAFEPALMRRAEALVGQGERAAWWRRQRDAADRLLEEVAKSTDEDLIQRYDPERHALVHARAAHPIAVDALLAGRYRDASAAWIQMLFQRAERLGADHPRVRDARLEYALMVELSHLLARSPAESPLPDPPLSASREPIDEDTSLLDRDLLDADLAAAVGARLAAASTPRERARLAVLAAEIALTREGAAGLETALGHYRTALEAHGEDDFDRHLLLRRFALLEEWRAARR
jgi:tetratricopeptide (TPR) repeat protein